MNKVILSSDDLMFLLRWRDEHKDLVRRLECPMRAVVIVCPDTNISIKAVRKGNIVEALIKRNDDRVGKIVFEITDGGFANVKRADKNIRSDDIQSVLTVYASLMALFVYGGEKTANAPVEGEKTKTIRSPSGINRDSKARKNVVRREHTVYILKGTGEPRLVSQNSHSSPQGEFSVRGHYRHYRNGRVVWISEYVKGKGKTKTKTYKLRSQKDKEDN